MKILIKKGDLEIEIITKDIDLGYGSNVDNIIKLIKNIIDEKVSDKQGKV